MLRTCVGYRYNL